jgi:hypothetical protein
MSWGASRAALVGAATALLVSGAIAVTAGLADAKSTYESPYGYDRTWNAALRLVRVDNGWKVTEKDDRNGYLLFDYQAPDTKKVSPGTLELIRGQESDSPVSVLVQLPSMPHAHEQVMIDQLAMKMRHEYGDPPVRKKRKPQPPPEDQPDAGDAGAD